MVLDYNFFEPDENQEPQKGKVLLSEPFLMDNYFKRSIVLLTEHNEDGTIGFVLNKPVDVSINEVVDDFPRIDADVVLGGPVNTNTLHYLHTLGDIIPNSVPVLGNISWGGETEVIERLITSGNISRDQIRFFLGYSGWSPNQLEEELSDHAWVVGDINPKEVMSPMNKHYWTKTLSKMGKKYKMWANFPENPEMN